MSSKADIHGAVVGTSAVRIYLQPFFSRDAVLNATQQ